MDLELNTDAYIHTCNILRVKTLRKILKNKSSLSPAQMQECFLKI